MTTLKQYRYAKLLTENQGEANTKQELMLKAGYSEHQARHPLAVEKQQGFQEALQKYFSPEVEEKARKVIEDGLDAEKTIVYGTKKNPIVANVPDLYMRHKYADLFFKVQGILKGRADDVEKESKLIMVKWMD